MSRREVEAASPEHPAGTAGQVRDHYRRWPFPGIDHTSREGLVFLRTLHELLHESGGDGLRVADVGCGTGHTLTALARHFPGVRFTGFDATAREVEIARARAVEAGAGNVECHVRDIATTALQAGEFDVVLCLGVLHHIPRHEAAFSNLAAMLRPGGHLFLWLYGRYGRAGTRLNQRFLRLLTRGDDAAQSLELARRFARELGQRYAVDTGFHTPLGSGADGLEWLQARPQWLADQFLPAFEKAFSMPEILGLFAQQSVELTKWLGVANHLRQYCADDELVRRFDALSHDERLTAIDLLIKPSYYFVVGRLAQHGEQPAW